MDVYGILLVVRYLYLAVSLHRVHCCLGVGAPTCTYSKAGDWWCFAGVLGVGVVVDCFVVFVMKSLVVSVSFLVVLVVLLFIVWVSSFSCLGGFLLALCFAGVDSLSCLVVSRLALVV